MTKEIVHMRMDSAIRNSVKEIAEADYNGVFTAAIESLLNQAITMRSIDQQKRWTMYSAAKNSEHQDSDKEHMKFIRSLVDGLHL